MQQARGLFRAQLRWQRVRLDFLAVLLLAPKIQVMVEPVEYLLQPLEIKSCSLPKLSRGRFQELMGVAWVALDVFRRRDVETESRANQRPACIRVGIGRKHPIFKIPVSKDGHEAPQAELNVGVL